jgi:hypothetical protein
MASAFTQNIIYIANIFTEISYINLDNTTRCYKVNK